MLLRSRPVGFCLVWKVVQSNRLPFTDPAFVFYRYTSLKQLLQHVHAIYCCAAASRWVLLLGLALAIIVDCCAAGV